MDPEKYDKIFGYLSDKKYPNEIKESEKRRIRKMSYKIVIVNTLLTTRIVTHFQNSGKCSRN
jgi:hypothetical protein